MGNLVFLSQYSKSNDKLGCHNLFKNLSEILRQKNIIDKDPEFFADKFDYDSLFIGGSNVPIGQYKKEAYAMTLEAILSDISKTWINIRDLSMIVISGGGSFIFFESIKQSLMKTYGIKEDLFIFGNEFLNSRGFLRFGLRKWRDKN
jgi:hypothetical protein